MPQAHRRAPARARAGDRRLGPRRDDRRSRAREPDRDPARGLVGASRATLLLTHIHLDHAGATGALVERFPDLEVYVHARGAPHLVDPSRLLSSAERIYGDDMQPLWGRVVPVPERNLRVLEGGETITVGGREFDVEYTPGHASHHVVYFDRSRRRPPTSETWPACASRRPTSCARPTPPPDIDVEAWQRSIDLVAARRAGAAGAHAFRHGRRPAAAPRPDEAGPRRAGRARARRCSSEHGDTEEAVAAFVAEVDRRTREAVGDEIAGMFEVGSPVEQRWLGLRRYWQKQAGAGAGLEMMATETVERPRVGGPGHRRGRRLARDRPERQPQHVRPRGARRSRA